MFWIVFSMVLLFAGLVWFLDNRDCSDDEYDEYDDVEISLEDILPSDNVIGFIEMPEDHTSV